MKGIGPPENFEKISLRKSVPFSDDKEETVPSGFVERKKGNGKRERLTDIW